ncbi:superoxide dismutase, Fe-Mn [Acrasis kona]|uniref:Superoxide dismutase n=1 Tax=Acrasis kona TaxID=1008807 RepID=A0AAW2ZE54_9EUKA
MLKNATRLIRTPLLTVTSRSQHSLPKLDYPVEGGVPPCISPKQLDYHYNKHHKTYIDKLNGLLPGSEFEGKPLDQIIVETAFDQKHTQVFNNAAQHFNHSFYWKCMTPNGSEFKGEIANAINKQYGSLDSFKKQFTEQAVALFGSGWAWLILKDNQISIWKSSNAGTPFVENAIPLLTCDVWEHAYYLDHQNRRPEYLKTFWDVVNWDFVNQQLVEASSIKHMSE